MGQSIHIAAAFESYNGETVKPQPRRNDEPAPTDPHLAELLDFRPDKGIIRLHEQRVVILSAAAMGLLRKELIDTLGLETARRVAIRFGYADGYHDAVNLRERSNWSDPVEGVRAGAVLHRLEGIVRTEVSRIDHDASTGRFEEEVIWHDSYVAEQHVHHYGKTSSPVCWSLVGYASGFVSACMGREIYFRETSCIGQGAKHCVAIGRDAESWGPDLESIRADFQAASVGHEVERLHEAASKRLKELDRRERLLERRERELNLLRERVNRHAASKHFIAGSQAMQDALELAARVAPLVSDLRERANRYLTGNGRVAQGRASSPRKPVERSCKVDAGKLVERYLDTWNETDTHARGSAVASIWAEDSRYVDPQADVAGRDEIRSDRSGSGAGAGPRVPAGRQHGRCPPQRGALRLGARAGLRRRVGSGRLRCRCDRGGRAHR